MNKKKPTIKRRDYTAPALEMSILKMEQGIAAGSATVVAPNNSSEVLEEWDIGTDRNTDIIW